HGVLETSRYVKADGTAMPFFTVNNSSIDRSTGLVLQSKDATGVPTDYSYDTSGRIKTVTPLTTTTSPVAPTAYDYLAATSSTPARITAVTGGAGAENRIEQQ